MGFGGGGMFGVGGGGLGGGGGGGGMFGGQRGPAGGASPGSGLPFAGIPPELQDSVEKLLKTEPEHDDPEIAFSHQEPPHRRLTLMSLIKHQWRFGLLSLVFIAIETVGLQTGPFLTQIGIDSGLGTHPPKTAHAWIVVWCGVAYILSVIATVIVERLRVRTTGRLAAYVMHDLRVRVFDHIQRLSLDFFTDEKGGVIMSRMTSDIEVLQQLLQDGIAQFAIQGLTMIVVTVILFTYNVELAWITIAIVVPVLTLMSLWFRSASERAYLQVRDTLAGVIGDIAESLSGIRVIAAYGRHLRNVLHHRSVVRVYRQANFRTARITAAYGAGSDLIGLIGQLSILLIGGNMVLHHRLEVGQLIAFILYLGSFFQPIQQLVQLYNTYQQGQAAVTKLRILLDTPASVPEHTDAVPLRRVEGAVAFHDVSFGYAPGRYVLEDVNLDIKAGESIAFVGPTGAGKSTIAKLVTRFYDPSEGTVTIDGQNIADVEIKTLRQQLGVVPQEPFLFTGTIRDNVAFARPSATDDEVLEAIRLVGLEDLVERLPEGIHTQVHERGQSLSSGERQLIALARAFVASPRVLVLDEATSNLDLLSEVRVEAALDRLLEGRTAILIAHRLSTAMRADRIVVVYGGRIVEQGSHDELVSAGGRYAKMYETWSSGEEEYLEAEAAPAS
jgi:ATP-binding cassette, subfamily B, bacterial